MGKAVETELQNSVEPYQELLLNPMTLRTLLHRGPVFAAEALCTRIQVGLNEQFRPAVLDE